MLGACAMQALKSLEESEQWDMVSNEGFKLRYQHLHGTPSCYAKLCISSTLKQCSTLTRIEGLLLIT